MSVIDKTRSILKRRKTLAKGFVYFFVVSLLAGVAFGQYSIHLTKNGDTRIRDKTIEFMSKTYKTVQESESKSIAIFKHNIRIDAMVLLLFIFSPIIVPILLFTNGFILGFAVTFLGFLGNQSPIKLFVMTLPHGIIEIGAIILTCVISTDLLLLLIKKETRDKKHIINAAHVFVIVIIPMLAIAALIEGITIFLIS